MLVVELFLPKNVGFSRYGRFWGFWVTWAFWPNCGFFLGFGDDLPPYFQMF
jgi:hypothetical protein